MRYEMLALGAVWFILPDRRVDLHITINVTLSPAWRKMDGQWHVVHCCPSMELTWDMRFILQQPL